MAEVRYIPGSEEFNSDGTVQAFGIVDTVTGAPIRVPNLNGEHDMVMEQERQMNAQPVATSAPMGTQDEAPPTENNRASVSNSMKNAFGSAPAPVVPVPIPLHTAGQPSGTPMPGISSAPAAVEMMPVPVPTGPNIVELQDTKSIKEGEGSSTKLTAQAKAAKDQEVLAQSAAIKSQYAADTAKNELEAAKATAVRVEVDRQMAEEQARKAAENADRMQREAEVSADISEFSNMKIDNNRRWANASTGDRVVTGIALILGAMGSAFSGKENPVLKMMDDDIRRDIEAQKAAIQNKGDSIAAKRGMLSELDKRYGDLDKAAEVARTAAWKSIEAQFAEAAAKNGNPAAIAARDAAAAKVAEGKTSFWAKEVTTSAGKTRSEASTSQQIPKALPGERITDDETKKITNAAIRRVAIDDLMPGFNDPEVRSQYGQIGARVGFIERMFNETSPEADSFKTKFEALKMQIRNEAFGASLTESEISAFENFVPNDKASADRLMRAILSIRESAELTENTIRGGAVGRTGVPAKVGRFESDAKARDEAIRAAGGTPPAK